VLTRHRPENPIVLLTNAFYSKLYDHFHIGADHCPPVMKHMLKDSFIIDFQNHSLHPIRG